jgi:hypothetical protein
VVLRAAILAFYLSGCAVEPRPVVVAPPPVIFINPCDEAWNEYEAAETEANFAQSRRQIGADGWLTINETLRRTQGYLREMDIHRRRNDAAESQSWAEKATTTATLARQQIQNEVRTAHLRPPVLVDRL